MGEQKKTFVQLLLAAGLSGSFLAAVLGFLLLEQNTRMQEGIKGDIKAAFEVFRSRREWQEQSLAELMGPVYMQLRRTKIAFDRWKSKNLYLESKIIANGNKTILNLLLTKGHLIPSDLRECADRLVEHYDVWLEEFERKRLAEEPDLETPFVFVFTFPSDCDTAFREKFDEMWKQTYEPG